MFASGPGVSRIKYSRECERTWKHAKIVNGDIEQEIQCFNIG